MAGLSDQTNLLYIVMQLPNTIMIKNEKHHWNKDELKCYILLLCAKADAVETKEELDLIKSMTTYKTFQKIYAEFCKDGEDQSLEKIRDSMRTNDYSYWELAKLRKEIEEVFASDGTILKKENTLRNILDKILY